MTMYDDEDVEFDVVLLQAAQGASHRIERAFTLLVVTVLSTSKRKFVFCVAIWKKRLIVKIAKIDTFSRLLNMKMQRFVQNANTRTGMRQRTVKSINT